MGTIARGLFADSEIRKIRQLAGRIAASEETSGRRREEELLRLFSDVLKAKKGAAPCLG